MSESQGAKLSCRTLRSSAVAGCDVQVSHPAMFFLTILRKSGGKGKVDANVLGVSEGNWGQSLVRDVAIPPYTSTYLGL